jgi:hypothetical protein
MLVVVVVLLGLVAAPAEAKPVDVAASPNPAALGQRVRHTVTVGVAGRLEVWVSASGFQAPGSGSLPLGTWSYECCPGQTAGSPAWHYRSSGVAAPGSYRFGAVARTRGTFLSSAAIPTSGAFSSVWIVVR